LLPVTWDHIAATTTWPHLTELSLRSIATTGHFWEGFFQRHSTTLISLELDEVTLLKGNWVNTFVRMKAIVESTHVLQDAKFLRGFFDGEDKHGVEMEEKGLNMSSPLPPDPNSLGSRLSDYLIHDGQNPLSVLDDDDDDTMVYYSYDEIALDRYARSGDTDSQYSYDEMNNESEADEEDNRAMEIFREELAIEAANCSLDEFFEGEASR